MGPRAFPRLGATRLLLPAPRRPLPQVRLMQMNLVSRLIGTHKLLLLPFYSFVQRYLGAHTAHVTQVLAYLIQVRGVRGVATTCVGVWEGGRAASTRVRRGGKGWEGSWRHLGTNAAAAAVWVARCPDDESCVSCQTRALREHW